MLEIAKKVTRTFYPYQYSPVRRILEPRRIHAYCIGSNKSGTHSIASMFAKHYRSSHEEAHGALINGFLDWKEGKLTERDFQTILLNHNKYAWLEMDSSHVHIEYVEYLVKYCPKAKFILTIRDCYSWLDSFFNHCLNHPLRDRWARLNHWRYAKYGHTYSTHEDVLRQSGFLPLSSYFSAWTEHNQKAIDSIPQANLLIVRTHEISSRVDSIANFLDIRSDTLDTSRSHNFKAPKMYKILTHIDSSFILHKSKLYCSDLMANYFGDANYLDKALNKL